MCSVVNEIILFGYLCTLTEVQSRNYWRKLLSLHQSGHKLSARVSVVHASQCNMLSACSIKEEYNELDAHGMGIGVQLHVICITSC